jgi:predicted aminopeptidase
MRTMLNQGQTEKRRKAILHNLSLREKSFRATYVPPAERPEHATVDKAYKEQQLVISLAAIREKVQSRAARYDASFRAPAAAAEPALFQPALTGTFSETVQ